MLIRKMVRINQAKLDFFILQVNTQIKLDDIIPKLNDFKKFAPNDALIALEIEDEIDLNKLETLIINLDDALKNIELKLYAIKYKDGIELDNIYGIPVIDFPKTHIAKPIPSETLIIDEPVRSGMVFNNDGDIIITSFVSNNAEIVASGNIHIYGEARGRLIAGNSGNKQARIFVNKFNAELISIAGFYRTIDSLSSDNVMIYLNAKNKLIIENVTSSVN
jgi:septum site-determining protein MinC